MNADLNTFSILWNQYSAWDYVHFKAVLDFMIQVKWAEGIKQLADCYTTDCIFGSLSADKISEYVHEWINKAKESDSFPEIYILCLKEFKKIAFFTLL